MNSIDIDVYSHHLTVTGFSPRGKEALLSFCRTMGQVGKVKVNQQLLWKIVKVFVGVHADRSVFRFHVNQLEVIKEHFHRFGYLDSQFNVRFHKPEAGVDIEIKLLPKWIAREHQVPIIDYCVAEGNSKTVALQTGQGKEQSLNSLVKIPGGWKRMGDMQVGDTVTAWDGTPTKVVGVYPQGVKQMYRITFADGRSTLAGAEHLWKVYYINTQPHKRWKIVNTLEMLRLISMPNPRVYVPLCEAEDSPDVDLPISPYTLGVLLGDGCLSKTTVTITKGDSEVIDYVREELPIGLRLAFRGNITWGIVGKNFAGKNVYIEKLRELGLMGKRSWEKNIPKEYLLGSKSQRLSLLQGLLDTDGTVSITGSSSFASASEQLANDVAYLVRSLGGIALVTKHKSTYTYKGELLNGRLCYSVGIRYPKPSELFRLTRKSDRTNDLNQYAADLKLRVKSIEPEGLEEAQCISIEHKDHLYVTDDFIVTHNTFLSLASAARIGKRTALTMKGGYIKKWCGDIKATFGYGPKEIMVIQGSKDLKTAIALGLEGKIDSKFIFFSNKTMHSFLKHYESTNGDTSLYGCAPQDLYRILGIGLIIRDEVHQDFHLNFRLDLYTHVTKTINLSATLHSGSPFLNKMYLVMFPSETRYKGSIYKKYIGVTGLSYRVADPRKVKSMSFGFKSYSHVIFEESLMRNGKLLQDYLAMIFKIVDHKFLQERKSGQKMIIFFAKVEMCSIAMDYIQKRVPALTVKRKTMDDPYENVLTADILVSTLMSAGTALDIPGLLRVLMTVSIDSPQANEQAMGRLREMTGEWAGTLVEFLYLFCLSVPKQVDYHYNKIELLKDKAKFHNERALNITIG